MKRLEELVEAARTALEARKAFTTFLRAGSEQGLYSRQQIEANAEFQAYVDAVYSFPGMTTFFQRQVVVSGLLNILGVPVDAKEIHFLSTPSIPERFLWVLQDDGDVSALRHHLAPGQIWLRHDVIAPGQLFLAIEWANLQRHAIGMPPRRRGRPTASGDPDLRAFLDDLSRRDPNLPLKSIHDLACAAGIRHGPYDDPADPTAISRNKPRAQVYRRRARLLREARERDAKP